MLIVCMYICVLTYCGALHTKNTLESQKLWFAVVCLQMGQIELIDYL